MTSPRHKPLIGCSSTPLVIAEIGVNHDGDPSIARDLIGAAAEHGADAVKFQFFNASRLLTSSATLAQYQARTEADPVQMLDRLELSSDQVLQLCDEAQQRGLSSIVTVFSPEDAAICADERIDVIKIASPDLVNRPLIESCMEPGKPIILSTGASGLDEIRRTLQWMEPIRPSLLQCVSAYPVPIEQASLGGIGFLADATGLVVGYSDHTMEVQTGAMAVLAGAMILEKHITHSRAAHGPDHSMSLDPVRFGEYVRLAREAARILGPRDKHPLPIEQEVRLTCRQSVTMTRSLEQGAIISHADLRVARPGTGIPAWELERLCGRRLAVRKNAGEILAREDLVDA
ncbi:MAG: hypothetical protein CMJ32_09870 [Phycisphaerae bacterium]|nr:hypothetical protein [Phycisphaerae bacterium]